MKTLGIVLVALLGAAYCEPQDNAEFWKNTRAVTKKCQGEHSISEEDVKTWFKPMVFPDEDNVKCFLKCLMVGTNTMNSEGVYDTEKSIEFGSHMFKKEDMDTYKGIVKACHEETKGVENSCQLAFDIFGCQSRLIKEKNIRGTHRDEEKP